MWKKIATAIGLSVAPLAGLMAKPAEASRPPRTVCTSQTSCRGTTYCEFRVCYEDGREVENVYVEVDNAPECGGSGGIGDPWC